MSTLAPPLFAVQAPALAAAAGFAIIAIFQLAIAAGAPLGRASYGGKHAGRLPAGLRVASAVAVVVWTLAAFIVLGRAEAADAGLPEALTTWGSWLLVGLLALGALMNFASPSRWERFLWGPFTVVLAVLCLLVARGGAAAG